MSAPAEDLYHRYRFSVDEYLRMGEAGILTEDDRVELLDGEIIDMPPVGIPHTGSVNRIGNKLKEQLGTATILSVQNPIRIGDFSLPQPDIALLRPRDDFYAAAARVLRRSVSICVSSAVAAARARLPSSAMAGSLRWSRSAPGWPA
jgi:Uma2 family endonuclease